MEQFSTKPQASAARQEKVVLRRIRAIDIEIRSGTYPNTNDLAKKLEVGVRTISRDIEEMKLFYNAPIAFDRAKNGYYYTEDSFYIKDISLSEGELFSVALFERLLSGYRNTPLEKHLRSVFRKIAASLGERATIDTMYLDDSVTYISEPLAQIDAEVFNTVFSAVRTSKEIRFDYRPLQKQTYMSRTVRPYHIVCQKGSWYVIGFDSYKSDIRIFAFSRIKNATTTGETFEIPEDFDWRKYIDADIGVWASSQVSHKIRLRFSAEIATFASEHIWSRSQTVTQNEDGTVEVAFETTQLPEVQRWVLGQGHTVQVLEPQELIDAVKAELSQMGKMYGNT
ncbi:WYL domain-containing protein [Treponema sp.]|uniref:helix-turn-helix transcriptional regulator n=1 Tax=Treponema sp. TaxID=166 RepID=UPI0025EDDD1D|nr:WYL domain-containing protein [Treponema sp.]MBR4320929.1 WYL domain-containing protein [Treponema sp.]